MGSQNSEVTEDTRIPIKAVIGLVMVLIPLTAWLLRVEWTVGTKVDKEQYAENMNEIRNDLKAIKNHLKIKE